MSLMYYIGAMEIKKAINYGLDALKLVLIALAIVIPVRLLIFQPFVVRGQSMEPNYHSSDYLIIDEVSYKLHQPERGDVIVFKYPKDPSVKYIKRIIGLPGETVEIKNAEVFITSQGNTWKIDESYLPLITQETWRNSANMAPTTLNANEYFVLGDNRNASYDSRAWGVVPMQNIVGKIVFRLSPFEALVKE
ncbi:MAG: signal peptidase I [Candidatus Pacebacteria bacterium]|nr:signal peptidase I [Candidatus Paceibacterota bacterium]